MHAGLQQPQMAHMPHMLAAYHCGPAIGTNMPQGNSPYLGGGMQAQQHHSSGDLHGSWLHACQLGMPHMHPDMQYQQQGLQHRHSAPSAMLPLPYQSAQQGMMHAAAAPQQYTQGAMQQQAGTPVHSGSLQGGMNAGMQYNDPQQQQQQHAYGQHAISENGSMYASTENGGLAGAMHTPHFSPAYAQQQHSAPHRTHSMPASMHSHTMPQQQQQQQQAVHAVGAYARDESVATPTQFPAGLPTMGAYAPSSPQAQPRGSAASTAQSAPAHKKRGAFVGAGGVRAAGHGNDAQPLAGPTEPLVQQAPPPQGVRVARSAQAGCRAANGAEAGHQQQQGGAQAAYGPTGGHLAGGARPQGGGGQGPGYGSAGSNGGGHGTFVQGAGGGKRGREQGLGLPPPPQQKKSKAQKKKQAQQGEMRPPWRH